ncbi:PorT family protein [Rhodohalobacter sp. SW132]|uniref:porin family protein n=1 Tax=Rhodohalobacter sp. SW132 TaxID=2293433 RepID=UPI000E221056|nr:porin family protein [Rhodohalobacter sp. SW132]REL24748.1 PorT family protein [Rhodohalobacter sp. SW132]
MNKFRLLSSSILFLILTLPFFVQEAQSQSVGIGVKVGPAVTSHLHDFRFVSGDIDLSLTPNPTSGIETGLMFRQWLGESLRLQIEPSLITMGASYEEGFQLRGFNFQTVSETDLLYIQVPILFQLTTTPPERIVYGRPYSSTTYHLTGGVFGGYLMSAQFSGSNTGAPIGIEFSGDFSNDVKNQYSDFDAGLIIGAGLEHGYNNRIGFETRLMLSVLDAGSADAISFKPHNMGAVFSFYLML